MRPTPRFLACALLIVAPLACRAQQTLTLEDALKMAQENNGDVKAAYFDAKAAGANVGVTLAAFYPNLTPTYQYIDSRQEFAGPTGNYFLDSRGGASVLSASWRILDSGERQFSLLASRRKEDAAKAQALQTLRTTLFGVYSQFVAALEAQELEKVDEAQVQRTNTILDQTKARVEAGDVAAKEVLQSQADALNAKVAYLASKNRTTDALAGLKSVIGWAAAKPLPELAPIGEPESQSLAPLEVLTVKAMANRQDLISARRQLDAYRFSAELAERRAGPTFAADVSFAKPLDSNSLESRVFTLSLTGPFFDGGAAQSQARVAKFAYLSAQATYTQQERQAKADIEAAYKAVVQNQETVSAARAAREAARSNYQAAVESQKVGASNLIDVLTAQVSLITAESNYVQSLYESVLAGARLDLELGRPMPGEKA